VAKDFRFGMSMRFIKSREAFVDKVKRAEDVGFDILCVPDHLGAASPTAALTAAAMVTTKLKLSMYVLNAAFYKPALLSRDLGDLDKLSDGRLEIGLGTGYVKEEFEAAELPYPSAGARVDYLKHMTTYLAEHHPKTPILIAGNGDRVLTIAAQHAHIIGLTGSRVKDVDDPLTERVEFVRKAAGDRFDSLELNLAITALPPEGETLPDLKMTRSYAPGLSDEELLEQTSVLSGTPREMADRLTFYREKYGVTSVTVLACCAASGADGWLQVIGVVGNVHDGGLAHDPGSLLIVPDAQVTDGMTKLNAGIVPLRWVIRTHGDPHPLIPQITEQLRLASGGFSVSHVRTMDEIVSRSMARDSFNMLLLTIFGGVALVLAAIGIYGLMAYSVEQRTQEMGIRMALGADRDAIRKLVVWQGMRLALVGVVLGLGAAFGLTRLMANLLYGVKAMDAESFVAAPLILAVVALAAVWLPAARASNVDPMRALRTE